MSFKTQYFCSFSEHKCRFFFMKINIDLMFICKAKFKGIIDKIPYFYNIFMCFLKILLVWTFKGWTKSIKEYKKYLNLCYKHEQKFNKLMMTICILGWTNDFKYIYIYIYSITFKNKIINHTWGKSCDGWKFCCVMRHTFLFSSCFVESACW